MPPIKEPAICSVPMRFAFETTLAIMLIIS
jgi:hypothetical protein